jgi:hypothetical protein
MSFDPDGCANGEVACWKRAERDRARGDVAAFGRSREATDR